MVTKETTMTVTVPNDISNGLLIVDVGQGSTKINISANNAVTVSDGELELLLYHETICAASVYGEIKLYKVKNISAGSIITITPSAYASGWASAMSVLLFSV